ncbi:MAG: ferric reductase-like transmembrane domain-containing protein [Polymorphobacter sp.]
MMTRCSAAWFWLLIAIPAVTQLAALRHPDADLDQLTQESGEWAVRLLVAALSITPLLRWFPQLGWLRQQRRAIGLAAFATGLVHLGLYVAAMGALSLMLNEITTPGIWTGWAALALMLPLAVTSNDAAMRRLGQGWKRLQRLAYPAALLALIHGALVHDGMAHAVALAAILLILELARLIPRSTSRKTSI